MKRIMILCALIVILLIKVGYAADEIEIPEEPMPSINKARLDTILIRFFTNQATVIVRKGFVDGEGNFVSLKEGQFLFIDRVDNPDTEIDETNTSYTDLMAGLGINKQFLKQAIKQRLQID